MFANCVHCFTFFLTWKISNSSQADRFSKLLFIGSSVPAEALFAVSGLRKVVLNRNKLSVWTESSRLTCILNLLVEVAELQYDSFVLAMKENMLMLFGPGYTHLHTEHHLQYNRLDRVHICTHWNWLAVEDQCSQLLRNTADHSSRRRQFHYHRIFQCNLLDKRSPCKRTCCQYSLYRLFLEERTDHHDGRRTC